MPFCHFRNGPFKPPHILVCGTRLWTHCHLGWSISFGQNKEQSEMPGTWIWYQEGPVWLAEKEKEVWTIPGHMWWTSLNQLSWRFFTTPRKILRSTNPIKLVRNFIFLFFFITQQTCIIYYVSSTVLGNERDLKTKHKQKTPLRPKTGHNIIYNLFITKMIIIIK